MSDFTISNSEIASFNENPSPAFPKYTSQIINLANQNAQATRPSIVGQMSELFSVFLRESDVVTVERWRMWYSEKYSDSFEQATEKIFSQIQNLKDAIRLIDRDMVAQWVDDLIVSKTFNGLYVQKSILAALAKRKNLDYRLASPAEEALGIDGYVGSTPYSIKPDTYKSMARLSETIDVKMIYYTKTKSGLSITVEK